MGHHHFVLIHGGSHGAWAWWKTVERLQKAGCRATAVDLTSAGHDTADPNTITSFAHYNKPAVDFMASLPHDEKVVVIGHSMGGYTNLELMESFPHQIALAIFVSTSVTPSGVAFADSPLFPLMFNDTMLGDATRFTFANGVDMPAASFVIVNPVEIFYNGCAPEDTALALPLLKPFPMQPLSAALKCSHFIHKRKTWTSAGGFCEELVRQHHGSASTGLRCAKLWAIHGGH